MTRERDYAGLAAELAGLLGALAGDGEPGLAVGVYSGGELAAHAEAGCASVEHAVPVTEHTVFDLARTVTLRQCLTHTAGLRDYFALCELAGIPVAGITEARFLHLVAGQRELDFTPGAAFCYSNTGYALAAVVVRRA